MDRDGWHKYMAHLPSIYFSYTLNTQVLLYDVYGSHFDDRELDIICIHNIQYFIFKAGDYVHDQTNDNGPNTNLKNFYGNIRMN